MATRSPPTQFFAAPTARTGAFFAPIQREFDRLFDQLGAAWDGAAEIDVTTRMDVRDTDAGVEITVEMPGVNAKDVQVSVEDGVLTISGEKKSETEREAKDFHVSERAFGAFSRSLTLPGNVDADKVSATMDKGVLTLVVPRNGVSKARTVKIQTAQ